MIFIKIIKQETKYLLYDIPFITKKLKIKIYKNLIRFSVYFISIKSLQEFFSSCMLLLFVSWDKNMTIQLNFFHVTNST